MNDGPLFPGNAPKREFGVGPLFLHSAHGADYYHDPGGHVEVITGASYAMWALMSFDGYDSTTCEKLTPEQRQHLETLAALYR